MKKSREIKETQEKETKALWENSNLEESSDTTSEEELNLYFMKDGDIINEVCNDILDDELDESFYEFISKYKRL